MENENFFNGINDFRELLQKEAGINKKYSNPLIFIDYQEADKMIKRTRIYTYFQMKDGSILAIVTWRYIDTFCATKPVYYFNSVKAPAMEQTVEE